MAKRSIAINRVKDHMRSEVALMMMNTVFGKKWYVVRKMSQYKGPGREIAPELVEAIIKEPDVHEGKDGLFPGISQTYHIG